MKEKTTSPLAVPVMLSEMERVGAVVSVLLIPKEAMLKMPSSACTVSTPINLMVALMKLRLIMYVFVAESTRSELQSELLPVTIR